MKFFYFLFLKAFSFIGVAVFLLFSCQSEKEMPEQKMPNILFAIADDASFPHAGAYGCTWVKTPGFDRVAKDGLLFMNAYTPNAKCAPSRSCIITGRNSWQLGPAANHWPIFPAEFKSIFEALAENGYNVGYTAKGWAPGKALDKDGNRRKLTGTAYNQAKTTPPANHILDNDYAENFRVFLDSLPEGQPFSFWYGSAEPHKKYEYGAGIRVGGKQLSDIDEVPPFWPDTDSVRTDMLDYAFELEYFDSHLVKMLALLEERGELENTIVVVTADNGMPFPRVKGQAYDMSNHLPLAIMWPAGIVNPGRTIEDFVSFIDFAPTFLEVAGLIAEKAGMMPVTGRSLTDIFTAEKGGVVNPNRDHVLIGKERHDVGRPDDVGYPIRGIVKGNYLYLHNFETARWPAGNPETGYLNVDGGPTKTVVIQARKQDEMRHFWQLNLGKRPQEEFYALDKNRYCIDNMAMKPELAPLMASLREQLFSELEAQGDPRMMGQGHIFDEFSYANPGDSNFYHRYMGGEEIPANWVEPSDFEKDFDEME